ncbi:energy-coupling factor transporter transmembrane component T family protein [Mycoplasmopsis lipophila]|uniref:energy-coupling factor transporter transmembrane component T family protein n=1 Tax=Mycoplasmopsis lipophila TaxID=2117 RepID=UPI003872CB19
MKSIFGRYLPRDSFIHRLDPRVKIIINIIYIVLVFISNYFITSLLLLIPIFIAFIVANRRILPLITLWKMPILIGIVIFLVNLYTVNNLKGEDYHIINWFGKEWWINKVKIDNGKILGYGVFKENIIRTLSLILRVYMMIITTSLLTNTTKPILLTRALEDLMWPLKFLFIPVHIIAMIISLALRFIPTLLDESKRIMKAQASRGVDFKNGKFKEKVKSFTTLVIPLFIASFSKADDLSNAMETRGYDPYAKRTRYRKLSFSWRDFLVLLVIAGLITYIILSQNFDVIPVKNWTWYVFTKTNV